MRIILIICFSLCFGNLYSQDFNYFINPNFEYYFEYDDSPGIYHTFSVVDSVNTNDSVLYFSNRWSYYNENAYCDSSIWGTGSYLQSCEALMRSNVFGNTLKANFQNDFNLINSSSFNLHFNLDLSLADSSLFYSNGIDDYYIFHENTVNQLFLGEVENFHVFSIQKFENGIVQNSAFDNEEFLFSSKYGFVRFFDVELFPENLRFFSIVGHNENNDGFRIKSMSEHLAWQPGDILVHREEEGSYPFGPSGFNSTNVYMIEETLINGDEIKFVGQVTSTLEQYEGFGSDSIIFSSVSMYEDTLDLSFSPLQYPINNFHSALDYYSQTMWSSKFNDVQRIKYHFNETDKWFCFSDTNCLYSPDFTNCFKAYEIVEGLGIVFERSSGFNCSRKELIAYKQGSEIYNDPYQYTTIIEQVSNQITIYPNPAKDEIRFNIETDIFEIYDLKGRLTLSGSGRTADLIEFANGIYVLKAFKDDVLYSQKIVKQ